MSFHPNKVRTRGLTPECGGPHGLHLHSKKEKQNPVAVSLKVQLN